ncbi:MAG: hypothetical protein R2882_10965 [Gemmatimonadales bacterium]
MLVVAAIVLSGFGVAMVRSSRRIAAERARTEQVAAMLADMFAGADPWVVPGDTLTVVAQLDRGRGGCWRIRPSIRSSGPGCSR